MATRDRPDYALSERVVEALKCTSRSRSSRLAIAQTDVMSARSQRTQVNSAMA